jgi:hypothetical protein
MLASIPNFVMYTSVLTAVSAPICCTLPDSRDLHGQCPKHATSKCLTATRLSARTISFNVTEDRAGVYGQPTVSETYPAS